MTTLGPVRYRRARYRNGASRASLVPVDDSLGLVDDYLTRPAACLGLLMMGHCTAREAEEFFSKTGGMTLARISHQGHGLRRVQAFDPQGAGPKSVAVPTVEARDAAGGCLGATRRAALSGRQGASSRMPDAPHRAAQLSFPAGPTAPRRP